MKEFISGATMTAFLVAALFFVRFWAKTKDRFFVFFALAFLMMGAERVVLALTDVSREMKGYVYLIRLAAFIVILAAVVDKNRSVSKR